MPSKSRWGTVSKTLGDIVALALVNDVGIDVALAAFPAGQWVEDVDEDDDDERQRNRRKKYRMGKVSSCNQVWGWGGGSNP